MTKSSTTQVWDVDGFTLIRFRSKFLHTLITGIGSFCSGATDPTGLVSFSNFTIKGPAGLYTVVPSVGGVDSTQAGPTSSADV